jgi:carboxylesterase
MEGTRASLAAVLSSVAQPFDLAGGPDAVLLLHGLTGTPFEVRGLAERLHASGMRCLGPVLAGHGGDPEDLAFVPWTSWVEGARQELERLAGARRVFLVGCSMGALVACVLAHGNPARIDGLALLSPAMRLKGLSRLVGFVARHVPFPQMLPAVPKLGGHSDVRDLEMRRINPSLNAVPLGALVELQDLAKHVDRILPGVVAPALVVMGGQDHTVARSGGRRLSRRIGSGPARIVVLAESYHLVGIDVERERCAAEVLGFFQNLR